MIRVVTAAYLEQQQLDFVLATQTIPLTLEDVGITSEDIPGWLVAHERKVTVALKRHIDDKLKKERIARELVNCIQDQYQAIGLDVQDRISGATARGGVLVSTAITANKA